MNLTGWTSDAADQVVEGMDETNFDTFALKIIVQGFLIWGTWKVIGFAAGRIVYGWVFAMQWLRHLIAPLVQGVLHLFGGK